MHWQWQQGRNPIFYSGSFSYRCLLLSDDSWRRNGPWMLRWCLCRLPLVEQNGISLCLGPLWYQSEFKKKEDKNSFRQKCLGTNVMQNPRGGGTSWAALGVVLHSRRRGTGKAWWNSSLEPEIQVGELGPISCTATSLRSTHRSVWQRPQKSVSNGVRWI